MKLPLAYYGDPVLRKKTAPITKIDDGVRQLVKDMEETMHEQKGIGLAAPQVHRSVALFIMCVPKPSPENPEEWLPGEFRVFINPKLSNPSEETWSYTEGCLSIPGVSCEIVRPLRITVEAMDLEGKTFREEFSGLEARVVMHENDHLNGVLMFDRVPAQTRKELESTLREIKKQYPKPKQ